MLGPPPRSKLSRRPGRSVQIALGSGAAAVLSKSSILWEPGNGLAHRPVNMGPAPACAIQLVYNNMDYPELAALLAIVFAY